MLIFTTLKMFICQNMEVELETIGLVAILK